MKISLDASKIDLAQEKCKTYLEKSRKRYQNILIDICKHVLKIVHNKNIIRNWHEFQHECIFAINALHHIFFYVRSF